MRDTITTLAAIDVYGWSQDALKMARSSEHQVPVLAPNGVLKSESRVAYIYGVGIDSTTHAGQRVVALAAVSLAQANAWDDHRRGISPSEIALNIIRTFARKDAYMQIAREVPFSLADLTAFFEEFIGDDAGDLDIPIRVGISSANNARPPRCSRGNGRSRRIDSAPITDAKILAVGVDLKIVPVISYFEQAVPIMESPLASARSLIA